QAETARPYNILTCVKPRVSSSCSLFLIGHQGKKTIGDSTTTLHLYTLLASGFIFLFTLSTTKATLFDHRRSPSRRVSAAFVAAAYLRSPRGRPSATAAATMGIMGRTRGAEAQGDSTASGQEAQSVRKIAAFDADGTLWTSDAAETFISWMHRRGGWERHGAFVDSYYAMLAAGEHLKAYGYVAQLFEGMTVAEAEGLCEEFYRTTDMESFVLPQMRSLIARLHAQGWLCYIVTASPTWVVVPGAARLGVPASRVLGVEVAVDGETGVVTAALQLPLPCRDGKVTALKAAGIRPQLAAGNTLDDVPMLLYASDTGLVVDPTSPALEAMAAERGWAVFRSE
ncbi:unnamed protein product, partial [Phaeothamnion confervicola]